ncbi:MAG TPA: DUF1049 domain-containing protein [Ignavibacteriaceae bacterium]|nr:DUF1049 domain-containing protein [Ignavibacteriaceae bacterium]
MNIKYILVLIALGLFIIVCLQNVEQIPMHFLFWEFNISKLLLLILILIIGIFIGMLIPGLLTKSSKQKDNITAK